MPALENLQLGCAVCRIFCYTVWQKLCCKKPMAQRPDYPVICLGLSGSGKTTTLALLGGETLENVAGPTTGFSIKAIQFQDCILNIKEIGGGEKIRPFWKHYYADTLGVIYVVNSADSEENLETSRECFQAAMSDPALRGLPCLVLANCQDLPGAKSESEIKELFRVEEVCTDREWVVLKGSKTNISQLRKDFSLFTRFFQSPEEPGGQAEGGDASPSATGGYNQI